MVGASLIILFFLVLSLIEILPSPEPSMAEVEPGELAASYAPILHFDPEERTFPVDAEYFINGSSLFKSELGGAVLIDPAPTAESLASKSDPKYYLDNQYGGLSDEGVVDRYAKDGPELGSTVYYHIAKGNSNLLIHYWFFYVFIGGGHNVHEGAWLMVQVVLGRELVPQAAMCSQHESGMRVDWSSVELNGESANLNLYVLRGSHTNSFYPFDEGGANGTGGAVLGPDDYGLKAITNWATSEPNFPWLEFQGRWGEWGGSLGGVLGSRGPQGPMFRQSGSMWEGINWGYALDVAAPPVITADHPMSMSTSMVQVYGPGLYEHSYENAPIDHDRALALRSRR